MTAIPVDLQEHMRSNARLNTEERHRGAIRLESTPLDVILEFTTRCNLKCVTCGRTRIMADRSFKSDLKRGVKKILRRHQMANTPADMPPEIVRQVFENFGRGATVLEMTGVGESVLTKHWELVLENLDLTGAHLFLVSNATALDERTMRYLIEREGTIRVSIDAATGSLYRTVRRAGAFESVLRNVKKLAALRREMNRPGFALEMAYVVYSDNLDGLMELVELAKECEVNFLQVLEMIPFTQEMKKKTLRRIPDRANEVLVACRRRAAELGIANEFPSLLPGSENLISETEYWELGLGLPRSGVEMSRYATIGEVPCHQPWTTTFVHDDGTLVPCCRTDRIMGNLQRKTFESIWNGRPYRRFRKEMLRYGQGGPEPGPCRGCSVLQGGLEPGPGRGCSVPRKGP